jgi:hypothetical protein
MFHDGYIENLRLRSIAGLVAATNTDGDIGQDHGKVGHRPSRSLLALLQATAPRVAP